MLDVAEEVFASKGFSNATMDEIAERVGVTKPLIYDYFGSKEGLLVAVVERARRALLTALLTAWAQTQDEAPRERVDAVVLAFFEFMDTKERQFIVLRSEGALAGEAGDSVERIRTQTAKALAVGLSLVPELSGQSEKRLAAVSEVVIGGCERLAVHRGTTEGLTSREATDLIMAMLLGDVHDLRELG